MTRFPWYLTIGMGLIPLAGCSSQMWVSELDPEATVVNGIPFRQRDQFILKIYHRDPLTGKYTGKPIYEGQYLLPDPNRLFVLKYLGLPLANLTAKVTIRQDGTLQTVGKKDSSQSAEALTAVGKDINAVNTQLIANEKAQQTEIIAEQDAELAFQQAMTAVAQAKLEMDAQIEGTTGWSTAANKLRASKIAANDKAARAGHSPPFPGVNF